jgi:hypothetical protein
MVNAEPAHHSKQQTGSSVCGQSATMTLFRPRAKGLSDHGIFISCDICPAGITEIENAIDLDCGFRTSKIARHKTAHIFSQRYTEFARSLARTLLYLAFECNLRS